MGAPETDRVEVPKPLTAAAVEHDGSRLLGFDLRNRRFAAFKVGTHEVTNAPQADASSCGPFHCRPGRRRNQLQPGALKLDVGVAPK